MELTDARKFALMAYCRIDVLEPGENILLETLYASAISYMSQAGISEPDAGTTRRAQYDLCVNALVLDAWDNRSAQSNGQNCTENSAFRRMLNQLKLTEPVPDSGTGSGTGG